MCSARHGEGKRRECGRNRQPTKQRGGKGTRAIRHRGTQHYHNTAQQRACRAPPSPRGLCDTSKHSRVVLLHNSDARLGALSRPLCAGKDGRTDGYPERERHQRKRSPASSDRRKKQQAELTQRAHSAETASATLKAGKRLDTRTQTQRGAKKQTPTHSNRSIMCSITAK